MRISAAVSLGLLGAFALAVAGCDHGAYSVGVGYQSGGYVVPPPPPPPGPPVGGVGVAAQGEVSAPVEGGEVNISMFYDSLAPYGRWIEVPTYGRCFVPAGVGPGWRPYTLGRWEYTDYGWTWMSDEPFGWATCHYGGWSIVAGYGWVWVPGTHWGPAWVAWRSGDGYAGWAPLPPRHGVDVSVTFTRGIPADHYTFVEDRYVTAPEIHRHVVSVQRNTTIISRTTNVTNIRVVNRKVVDQSLSVQRVERATGKRIQPKVLRTTDHPSKGVVRGNEVEIYHPRAARAAPEKVTPRRESVQPRPNVIAPPGTPRNENRVAPNTVKPNPKTENRVTPAAKTNAQYEAARRKLDQQHAEQLKAMELRQAKERQNRGDLTAAQLKKRQDLERQRLLEQHRREAAELRKKHNVKEENK